MNETLELKQWTDRYMAQWNEPDPEARSALIRELWAPDGLQVLVNPPEAARDAAANLGIPHPSLEVRGHESLNARVSRAYELFIEPGEHIFQAADEPAVLMPNIIAFRWSMVVIATGETVGGGLEIITLDENHRIRTDHQYVGMS
ncbi:hypothetical protein [Actinomadura montaniterrae]|uniref:Nuclear transport factor 2 family protein n=1 Tax=Actinomadura montaniterrae TaxID=1803903 RepID=A0A6L3VYN8_9ACTN|nr:hypothetical protein [Actinomadura montaniterrae]KAB2380737.1 hypothetical protein F9B16_17130 [Actinomadura montaniterrae]